METKKQKLLLEYLISSTDVYALCAGIIKSEFFDPEFRNTVAFIQQYFDQHHSLPSLEQIEAESNVVLSKHDITRDKFEYTALEIEQFCKQKAIEHAILKSPDLIEKKDYGKVEQLIRDAVTVSLNRNLGTLYFDDPMQRLIQSEENGDKISTGWEEVDKLMFGGLERGELLVFSANSGGGKSIALSNLALNFLQQGLNVVYFSFELSEKLISQRYDTMISGVSTAEWKYHKEKIAQEVNKAANRSGQFIIKQFKPSTKPMELRAYLKEYELKFKHTPDLIIVDYIDIMKPNEHVSADNVFEKDKMVSEQLRAIGMDYNAVVASASQQNRQAVDVVEVNQSHVAGGMSKVNTADWWISVIATKTMRAAGECAFQFLKTRSSDGVGSVVYLNWNKNIRITDNTGSKNQSSQLTLSRKNNTMPTPLFDASEDGPSTDLLDAFD